MSTVVSCNLSRSKQTLGPAQARVGAAEKGTHMHEDLETATSLVQITTYTVFTKTWSSACSYIIRKMGRENPDIISPILAILPRQFNLSR